MRALTVLPLQKNSLAVLDVPDPEPGEGDLLVDGLAVGVCGTDKEIALGEYGWAPPGAERLVIGHESLGRVSHAPSGRGFAPGDLVVGGGSPAGPGALSRLRARPVRHVPQRPVHRARDQTPFAGGQTDLSRDAQFTGQVSHLPACVVDDGRIQRLHSGLVPHVEVYAGGAGEERVSKISQQFGQRDRHLRVYILAPWSVRRDLKHADDANSAKRT
jgi:hypothetical protein